MTQPYQLAVLFLPAAVILATAILATWLATRSARAAIAVGLIKALCFVVYFGLLFDGSFTFLDDWSYLRYGRAIHEAGITLANLADNWLLILAVGGGNHVLYYLYNAWSFELFGFGYYAPVALNVIATLGVAWGGCALAAREFGWEGQQRLAFFVFLALHPDISVWSTIANGKDILVLLLHVLLLMSASLYYRGRWLVAVVLAILASLALTFLRFYVPLLFAGALLAAGFIATSGKARWRIAVAGGAGTALLALLIGSAGWGALIVSFRENLVNPVSGLVRFLLTPIPFNSDASFAFLDIPATIHWLLLPFALLGIVQILRKATPFCRFFLIYVGIFLALYAAYGELQGPRHRVQLDYAWAVFQFAGLSAFLAGVASRLRALSVQKPQYS